MNIAKKTGLLPSSLSTRASRLAALKPTELSELKTAEHEIHRWPARREIVAEGKPIRDQRALLSGWACRQRILLDGRRQILSFLLPGDLIGICQQSNPVAATSILAVSDVVTCRAPVAEPRSGLAEAYARSATLEEHHFLAQITRLGRLDARERVADWVLETRERLMLVDLSSADTFALPVTQEMLADARGLTTVHINRTLGSMRVDGLVEWKAGIMTILDRGRLERLVDHRPAPYSLMSTPSAASKSA
jgi:CRP-like cAMP-binding protein